MSLKLVSKVWKDIFSNLAQRVLSVIQDGSGYEMFDEESEFSEVLSDLEHVRVLVFSRTV